jgi:hypothetical protein
MKNEKIHVVETRGRGYHIVGDFGLLPTNNSGLEINSQSSEPSRFCSNTSILHGGTKEFLAQSALR